MTKQTQTVERSTVNLLSRVELKKSQDGKDPKTCDFELVAYTGAAVSSWWGDFVIDIEGIETKSQVPILREHARDRVVGWSRRTIKDDRGIVLAASFTDKTEDGKEVQALAEDGFPWQASVGVAPLQILDVKKGQSISVNGREFSGPVEIWTRSLVGEVSVVSWGADNNTSMQLLSADGERVPVVIEHLEAEGDAHMTLQELQEKHPEVYREAFEAGAKSVDHAALRSEGIAAERERVAAILSVDGADSESKHRAIAEGLTIDSAYKLFFEAERGKKEKSLKELEQEAPESLGYQAPKEPESLSGDPAAIVSEKAVALAASEKIDLATATNRVLSENKALAARYYGQYSA